MPDFSRPEYASYVQLCRELRLEPQEILNGDHYLRIGDSGRQLAHFVVEQYTHDGGYLPSADDVWLPSLADWLEMLEATGQPDFRLVRHEDAWEASTLGPNLYDRPEPNFGDEGPTREEATARLWMTVSRSPADPAPPPVAR